MDHPLSSIWRLFISRRFAVGLLMIISFMLFLGVLLPSLSYHTPEEMDLFRERSPILYKLGVTFNPPTLVNSWSFIMLTTLLFMSTIFCAIERLRNREFADPYGGTPEYFRKRVTFKTSEPPEAIAKRAEVLFKAGHWGRREVTRTPEKIGIMGHKGSFGFWGSLVFHLGFLIILAGAIISANTRLSATLLITEGQTIQVDESAFNTVARRPQSLVLPPLALELTKLDTRWADGVTAVDYTAWVNLINSEGLVNTESIKVNQATRHEKIAFLLENFGYAPGFRAVDESGQTVFEGFVNLKGRNPGSRDSFSIPEEDLVVETVFLPNKNDKQSLEPLDPVFHLTITKNGKEVFKGEAEQGKPVKAAGLDIQFDELRKWAYFRVTRDYGVDILFWGFVVSFIGLTVRFILHERTMKVTVTPLGRDSEIVVSGRSRYFPALFQETVDDLADRLVEPERKVV